MRRDARLVYSTGGGRTCPGCGWPIDDCKCSRASSTQALPTRIVVKLRVEKKGRGGKTVTVVDNLPRNADFIARLAQELKRVCGTGGTAGESFVELQGDLRERVREHLGAKGFTVKG